MAQSSASAQEKSQYHHFIPRFILRNYSHPSEPPAGPRKSQKRGRYKNGPRSTEPMLYGIDIAGEEAKITETTVGKTFGITDMYRDLGASTKQHHVEEQLPILESRAGEVVSTIRKAFEAGKPDVWITRPQRDTLRKFLFMKYQGSRFHKQYCHKDAEAYDATDKDRMLKYMNEKGFKKPIDVWFDNIKAILDLKMDYGREWMDKLRKRMYPDDAEWFINNVQQFYMALCTPISKEDEFLLTQNAYSIHEGASTERWNPLSGKHELSVYTELHLFAPSAPRLLIVLRSFVLPVPEEDFSDEIRELRDLFYKASLSSHARPETAGLLLRDLPISKALNSYSRIVDGRIVIDGVGPTGANDRFGFRFFSILEDYISKINGIMLEESYRIGLIIFNSKAITCKTLEHFLLQRCEFDSDIGRVRTIKKLQQASKQLRATLPAFDVPQPQHAPKLDIQEDKVHALFIRDGKAQALYFELSGNKALEYEDFGHARGLLFMRIKLDSSTKDFPEEARETARNNFLKVYDHFPVQVAWIYLKRIRFMKLGGTMIGSRNIIEDYVLLPQHLHGLEDVVASSRYLFRKEDFCRVMHHASFNESLIAKPRWGLVGKLTLDYEGMKRLHEEKELVLGTQGILKLEEAARAMREIVKTNRHEIAKSPFDHIFSEDEKIELFTRRLVRECKDEGTGKPLIENTELENVLFNVVYPLFGSRQTVPVETAENPEEASTSMVQ